MTDDTGTQFWAIINTTTSSYNLIEFDVQIITSQAVGIWNQQLQDYHVSGSMPGPCKHVFRKPVSGLSPDAVLATSEAVICCPDNAS